MHDGLIVVDSLPCFQVSAIAIQVSGGQSFGGLTALVQILDNFTVHFLLHLPVRLALGLLGELHLPDEGQRLVDATHAVDDALFQRLQGRIPLALEDHVPEGGHAQFDPEDGSHAGLEVRTEVELVQAHETLVGVHDAIVVHHCRHEATRERCVTTETQGQ